MELVTLRKAPLDVYLEGVIPNERRVAVKDYS